MIIPPCFHRGGRQGEDLWHFLDSSLQSTSNPNQRLICEAPCLCHTANKYLFIGNLISSVPLISYRRPRCHPTLYISFSARVSAGKGLSPQSQARLLSTAVQGRCTAFSLTAHPRKDAVLVHASSVTGQAAVSLCAQSPVWVVLLEVSFL